MNDCSNVEVRDQLPDLLHDRLASSAREVVVAHVADCVDCREELELLRGVLLTLSSRTPRVDVARIVAALPKPPVAGVRSAPAPRASVRRTRIDWRIAAAVTFLAVGGSSIALLEQAPSANRSIVDSVLIAPVANSTGGSRGAQPSVNAISAGSAAAGQGAGRAVASSASNPPVATAATTDGSNEAVADVEAAEDVKPGGRFADLSEEQLKSLLGDIGQLPDVPVTEPDPVAIQVNSGSKIPDGQ